MKMIGLLLLAFIRLISLSAGCGIFSLMKEPKLGQFRYTHQEAYAGAPIRVFPIWVDKNFGEADKLVIADAVAAWNYGLNGTMRLDVVDWQFDMEVDKIVSQVNSGGWLFLKIDHLNPLIPDNDPGFHTLGFTETVGGHHMYLVRDRLSNDMVFGVTLHEIGHLLGSPHVGKRLMYPHFTRARNQCIDFDSMWAVASYWGLPTDRLNYCVEAAVVEDKKAVKEEINCP